MWRYTNHKKSSTDLQKKSDSVTKSTNYGTQVKKQEEINAIYSQLKERHEGKFNTEQLHTWAHMLYLKTHDSLDNPPDKPFFTRKRSSVTSENTQFCWWYISRMTN